MAAGAIALGEPPSVDNMVSELPDNIFEGTPLPMIPVATIQALRMMALPTTRSATSRT